MVKNKTVTLEEEDEVSLFADEFHVIGFTIIDQTSTGSLQTQYRRFKAHFGIDWLICGKLWMLLLPLFCDDSYNLGGAKKKHLLWTLLFLRLYDTEEILAAKVGAVEKTYRKWVWLFVDLISYLQVDIVSF